MFREKVIDGHLHLAGGLKTLSAILLESLHDDGFGSLGNVVAKVPRRVHVRFDDFVHNIEIVCARMKFLSGQGLVEDAAQRKDIRACVDFFAQYLFG